jgi:hypothetical protein
LTVVGEKKMKGDEKRRKQICSQSIIFEMIMTEGGDKKRSRKYPKKKRPIDIYTGGLHVITINLIDMLRLTGRSELPTIGVSEKN